MLPKVAYCVWLLAMFVNRTTCQDKLGSPGSAGGSSGGEHGGSGGGGGSGSGGTSGGSGSGGGGGGKQGGSNNGSGDPTFTIAGINVGGGMQLPFPFFPPFGCDIDCQPIQIQFIQQKQQTQLPMITTPAAPPSTTQLPSTTRQPPPSPVTSPKPTSSQTTYTSQMYVVYPNWCQGWCRFFYKPPTQPVYYQQPNCILFSWMGMGISS